MTTVAVISDIHSNLSALRAVLTDIHHRPVNRIFCLGDLVGYYTQPIPVIHLILARCDVVVKGNHDVVAGLGEVPEHYRTSSKEPLKLANHLLTVRERKILHSLPTMHTEMIDKKKVMLIHGGPEFPHDQYIYPEDTEDIDSTFKFMELIQVDALFLGHTHVPMKIMKENRMICNPGSVGQPRDSDPRASYITFDSESFEVVFHRIPYDPSSTIEGIKKYHFPLELVERLLAGK